MTATSRAGDHYRVALDLRTAQAASAKFTAACREPDMHPGLPLAETDIAMGPMLPYSPRELSRTDWRLVCFPTGEDSTTVRWLFGRQRQGFVGEVAADSLNRAYFATIRMIRDHSKKQGLSFYIRHLH